jgi:hypothetical protein
MARGIKFNIFEVFFCEFNDESMPITAILKNNVDKAFIRNMHIPNLIRGRKVNHSFLSLLPSLGQ